MSILNEDAPLFRSDLYYVTSDNLNSFTDVQIRSLPPDDHATNDDVIFHANRSVLASVSTMLYTSICDLDPNEDVVIVADMQPDDIKSVLHFALHGRLDTTDPDMAAFEAFGINLSDMNLEQVDLNAETDKVTKSIKEEDVDLEDYDDHLSGGDDFEDGSENGDAYKLVPEVKLEAEEGEELSKRRSGRKRRKRMKEESEEELYDEDDEDYDFQMDLEDLRKDKVRKKFAVETDENGDLVDVRVVKSTSQTTGKVRVLKYKVCEKELKEKRKKGVDRRRIGLRKADSSRPYKCDQCDYSANRIEHLIPHQLRHSRPSTEKLFCLQCHAGFATHEEITAHRIEAHNAPTFTCHECGEEFYRWSMLTSHIECHEGVTLDSLHCVHCGYKSRKKHALGSHLRNMGKYHSSKCVQCSETFKSFKEHESHVKQVHNGVFVFICGVCTETFSTKRDRDKHRRENHDEVVKKWFCDICGQTIVHSFKNAHLRSVHGQEPTPCDVCGKEFKHPDAVKSHKKACHGHWPCEICGKVSKSEKRLKQHMISVHVPDSEKPFHCDICGKGFPLSSKLGQHMAIHENLRKHKCRFCNDAFNSPSTMKAHERMRHFGIKRGQKGPPQGQQILPQVPHPQQPQGPPDLLGMNII